MAVRRIFLFFVTIVVAIATNVQTNPCPSVCKCVETKWHKLPYFEVNCSNTGATLETFRGQNWNKINALYLNHNNLTILKAGDFANMSNLQELQLIDCSIEEIEQGAFAGLSELRALKFDKNPILQSASNLFSNLTQLSSMWLRSMELNISQVGSFVQSAENLHRLDISYNMFNTDQFILPDSFQKLTQLTKLILTNTGIKSLVPESFEPLCNTSLRELHLDGSNRLDHVNETAFGYLQHLNTLDLSYSLINVHNAMNIFSSVSQSLNNLYLQHIYTYGDDEYSLNKYFFDNLADNSIQILHMEQNYGGFAGGAIPDNFFSPLKHLKELYLDGSLISNAGIHTFKGLHKLQILSLRNNVISCTFGCVFLRRNIHLKGLTMLDLSDNAMSNSRGNIRFDGEVFPNLKKLYLNKNRIEMLNDNTFINLEHLRELDLSDNRLSYLDRNMFSEMKALRSLSIENNPQLTTIYRLTFHGLGKLQYLYLKNNALSNLPDSVLHGLKSLEYLDLQSNKLGRQISTILNVSLEIMPLTYLNLRDNHIDEIPLSLTERGRYLQKLYLGYNKIFSIEDTFFTNMSNLEILDLSHNNIMTFGNSLFTSLTSLKQLDISGNPFYCDCEIRDFQHWINSSDISNKLISRNNYQCHGPRDMVGMSLFYFQTSDWECSLKVVLLPVIFGVLLLLIAIGSVLVYKIKVSCTQVCTEKHKSDSDKLLRTTIEDEFNEPNGSTSGIEVHHTSNGYSNHARSSLLHATQTEDDISSV